MNPDHCLVRLKNPPRTIGAPPQEYFRTGNLKGAPSSTTTFMSQEREGSRPQENMGTTNLISTENIRI